MGATSPRESGRVCNADGQLPLKTQGQQSRRQRRVAKRPLAKLWKPRSRRHTRDQFQLQPLRRAEPAQRKILTSINGNTAPDLFIQHWDYTLTYSTGDKLADLKPLLSNVNFDDLDPGLLAYGRIDGQQVSIPIYGTSRDLGINRKFVVEAGLDPDKGPQNWAELREWAIALTKRAESDMLEVAGFSLFHNDLDTRFESWAAFEAHLATVDLVNALEQEKAFNKAGQLVELPGAP